MIPKEYFPEKLRVRFWHTMSRAHETTLPGTRNKKRLIEGNKSWVIPMTWYVLSTFTDLYVCLRQDTYMYSLHKKTMFSAVFLSGQELKDIKVSRWHLCCRHETRYNFYISLNTRSYSAGFWKFIFLKRNNKIPGYVGLLTWFGGNGTLSSPISQNYWVFSGSPFFQYWTAEEKRACGSKTETEPPRHDMWIASILFQVLNENNISPF